MLHVLKIISIFFITTQLYSQPFVYSKNYFEWPVKNKPGIVANFGELREGHWHMGLDIRTDQKVNMPVYAAAGGYIARISVHPFGYGMAIYINHPNGLTTVYGHLNKFFSTLDSFVREEQYKQQSWEIELDFTKDKFPVKKGQFIAFSGSSGSSEGPHVHFEIRDTKTERCINPFLFSLPVLDTVPPVLTNLAMYDRNISVYDQHPILFPVKKIKNQYSLKDELIRTGFSKLGFSIGAYDCVTGSTNPNGIYSAKIFLDKRPFLQFVLDSMDYNETGFVDAHIDYKYRYNGGKYLQQLFKLPGDEGREYGPENSNGTIVLNDTAVHLVTIEVSDIRKNTSTLEFKIQLVHSAAALINYSSNKMFAPHYVNVFEQNDFESYVPENCLYDSVEPVFSRTNQPLPNAVSALFQFGDASIPFHGKIDIRIKPNVTTLADLKNKVVIQRADRKGSSYKKAEWQKDWLAASFNDFGSYQAFIDSELPILNELGKPDTIDLRSSKSLIFYPKDNTGLKSFRAELDGKWLMFSNDKGAAWIYNFDERCPYGVHHLKVRVEDIVGNATEKEWWFKRNPYTSPQKKTLPRNEVRKKRVANAKTKVGVRNK